MGDVVRAEHVEAALVVVRFEEAVGSPEDALAAKARYLRLVSKLSGPQEAKGAARRMVESHIERGDAEGAVRACEALGEFLGREETDELLLKGAEALWKSGREWEAVPVYWGLVQRAPGSARAKGAYKRLAGFFHNTGDFRRAAEMYRAIAREFPGSEEAAFSQYESGYLLYMSGERDGAVKEFRAVLELYPKSAYTETAGRMLKSLNAK